MTVKIPEILKGFDTDCIDVVFEAFKFAEHPLGHSLTDFEDFYNTKLFLAKCQNDYWVFAKSLFEEIWLPYCRQMLLKNSDVFSVSAPENFDFCGINYFYVVYQKDDFNLVKFFIEFNWKEWTVCIGTAEFNRYNLKEKAYLPKNSLFRIKTKNFIDYENYSLYQVSLKENTVISDEEINNFKKIACYAASTFNFLSGSI